jgi:hypothetical protein
MDLGRGQAQPLGSAGRVERGMDEPGREQWQDREGDDGQDGADEEPDAGGDAQ